jgi:hypothetical protein
MVQKIEKVDVWSGEIRDEAGGLAAVLSPLVDAGADFSFLIARRKPDSPGAGVIFVGGIRGAKQKKAAQSVGLAPRSADFELKQQTNRGLFIGSSRNWRRGSICEACRLRSLVRSAR